MSDPGVTLIELLAYVGDVLSSYQDRVSAEQRRRRTTAVVSAVAVLAAGAWLLMRCGCPRSDVPLDGS